MSLSAAERQQRCREKRKKDPKNVAEVKRKDFENEKGTEVEENTLAKEKKDNNVNNKTNNRKENKNNIKCAEEESRKYTIVSNAIKKQYKDIKDYKIKHHIKKNV
ncbi:hypothetical protein FQA39_LY02354 [Lamprigera yunnana]|nr:hypothetical protein FQA39_LY02354 [Lamprigera yunnana]